MRDAMSRAAGGAFPLRVVSLPGQVTTQSPSGSGNYFRLQKPAGSPLTLRMQTPGGAPLDFAGARMFLVRLN